MNEAGHNRPPEVLELIRDTTAELGAWLKENPVILSEEHAREAKVWVDRASFGLADLEAERDGKVRPLNTQVKEINGHYREPREILSRTLDQLKGRLDVYIKAEEARRQREAEEAKRKAEEAAERLRAAEEKVRDAKDDADSGVEADVAAEIAVLAARDSEYNRLSRDADRAARDSAVRLGGGFGRSISARSRELVAISDAQAALNQIGWTEALLECLITEARRYRRQHGSFPDGITVTIERRL